jgi:hypothetical protein
MRLQIRVPLVTTWNTPVKPDASVALDIRSCRLPGARGAPHQRGRKVYLLCAPEVECIGKGNQRLALKALTQARAGPLPTNSSVSISIFEVSPGVGGVTTVQLG